MGGIAGGDAGGDTGAPVANAPRRAEGDGIGEVGGDHDGGVIGVHVGGG